jgi:nucleotide-binding universal stress UspA family protein
MKIETILVATDFSEDAEQALQEALALAKAFGARIHLVHTYHLPAHPVGPAPYTVPQEVFDAVRERAQKQLEAVEARVAAEGVKVASELHVDPASLAIVDAAHAQKADLICMGTRGLTGLKHVLLGSVAERTLRHAPCAVLTTHAPD